jgi:DNA-3-methyladenine glycosylase II
MRKALLHLKKSDPILAGIIERVGPYRMTHTDPNFQSLVRSIVYQQLSGKAAGTIYGRLIAASSDPVNPAAILALSPEEMRALGLSQQKTKYIRDLAERTAAAEIDFAQLPDLTDEEIIECLTRVKGVGVWTAHMFLMFSLQRPNVLPVGDLGIRNAIQKAYRLRKPPKPEQIEKIARTWHPYCSYASWYLWRSLENE